MVLTARGVTVLLGGLLATLALITGLVVGLVYKNEQRQQRWDYIERGPHLSDPWIIPGTSEHEQNTSNDPTALSQ